jgi:hypothetical protein
MSRAKDKNIDHFFIRFTGLLRLPLAELGK